MTFFFLPRKKKKRKIFEGRLKNEADIGKISLRNYFPTGGEMLLHESINITQETNEDRYIKTATETVSLPVRRFIFLLRKREKKKRFFLSLFFYSINNETRR